MIDLNIFLSDTFQYKLKANAANANNGRFEETLESYFKLFFEEFVNIQSSHRLKGFEDIDRTSSETLYNWIDSCYDELNKEIDIYKNFFRSLIDIYYQFIKGERYLATMHLFKLLQEYEIADIANPAEIGLFYKGRIISKGDVTSQSDYYYHIPFNLRHLVTNQRFSYSGQPILYLGSSILDVLYELRCIPNEHHKIAIASFAYDPMIERTLNSITGAPFGNLKIYDVTNHIHKLINQVLNNLARTGNIPSFNDPLYRPNLTDIRRDFKKFILTQVCTFKRNTESKFVAEYVLAQLLTEALSINGYHGVKFPSTQFDEKNLLNNSIFYPSAIQENLALFAKYSQNEAFDYELMKSFIISPLELQDVVSVSVAQIKETITNLQNEITLLAYNKLHSLKNLFLAAIINIGQVRTCQEHILIDGKPYLEWDFALLELEAHRRHLETIKELLHYFEDGAQIKPRTK